MEKHIHDMEKHSEDQKSEFWRCKACGYGEYRPKPAQEQDKTAKIADRIPFLKGDKPEPAQVQQPSFQGEEYAIMRKALENAEMLQMNYEWLTPEMAKDIAITMFIQETRRRQKW